MDLQGDVDVFTLIKDNQGKHVDKEIIRDLYDKWTPTYDKDSNGLQSGGPTKSGTLVKDLYQEKDISILDCGAGTGLVGAQLQRHGFTNIVALDISPKILEAAEQKCIYRKVVCAEVGKTRMPFEDDEFDVLVCSGCIVPFHISPDCFPEWIRIVKQGGHIVVVLRRCYVEVVKDEEAYYSKTLAESFEENIRNLENKRKWQVIEKKAFPAYLVEKGHMSEGMSLIRTKMDIRHEEFITLIKNNHGKNVEKKIIRELYDGWASTYDKHAEDFELGGPSKCGDLVRQLYPDKNISILDCGAGTGLVGIQLKHHGFTYIVALDMSLKSLEVAEQKGVYRQVVCAEVGEEKMPFKDGEFDVLVCNGCITPFHISPNSFTQWVRIVKQGGYIVISLRRCYVEVVKSKEDFYSQSLAQSFEENIRNLQNLKKWKMVSKEVFPNYLVDKGQIFEGIAMVFQVL